MEDRSGSHTVMRQGRPLITLAGGGGGGHPQQALNGRRMAPHTPKRSCPCIGGQGRLGVTGGNLLTGLYLKWILPFPPNGRDLPCRPSGRARGRGLNFLLSFPLNTTGQRRTRQIDRSRRAVSGGGSGFWFCSRHHVVGEGFPPEET